MSDEMELLKRVYDRFNARDMESPGLSRCGWMRMESVLAAMHEDAFPTPC